eukprot:TRINITY_DN41918_c0_g1_i1.p1 TRINITY_DN41918_c0_g1~~TRINITY_DN41918_c0_g1_i1.p1  ORF type:complete len:356 (-),score=50.60 TRINITY_DN41918_c0_g1_i1:50-1117(-)
MICGFHGWFDRPALSFANWAKSRLRHVYIGGRGRRRATFFVPATVGVKVVSVKVETRPALAAGSTSGCVDVVPEHVLNFLKVAYGNDLGQIGWNLKGHDAKEDASSLARRSVAAETRGETCLTYGELLPGGVSKALRRLALAGKASASTNVEQGILLELGMGTGMVALQALLQCPNLKRVIGVELSKPRFDRAVKALHILESRYPQDFRFRVNNAVEGEGAGEDAIRQCTLEIIGRHSWNHARVLDIRLGDFLSSEIVSDEEFRSATAIVMQVMLPDDVLARVQQRLVLASRGCRLFTLCDMESKWRNELRMMPNTFSPWRMNDDGSEEHKSEDWYATSWGSSEGVVCFSFRSTR